MFKLLIAAFSFMINMQPNVGLNYFITKVFVLSMHAYLSEGVWNRHPEELQQ